MYVGLQTSASKAEQEEQIRAIDAEVLISEVLMT